jgi:pyruvate dehydrogenase E2 component (dihydrolipoamide acetyltransferase)
MPKLGLTMTEGLVAEWRVRPGDAVQAGDVLFVVETEKIATEVAAQAAGRIETISAKEGETIPVGGVVATWTGPAIGAEPGVNQHSPVAAQAEAGPPPDPGEKRVIATPLARRLAKQAGLDLRLLRGSGPGGRIKAADIEAAARTSAREQKPKTPLSSPPEDIGRRSPSQFEKVIARRLVTAKQTIPHFYVLAEADVTRLLEVRQELNSVEGAVRISVNHFILAAAGRALARMPEFNTVWIDDEIIQLSETDIGVAVATPRGLLVPVLRRAGSLLLDDVAAQASILVERARAGTLQNSDLEGGALTISNVGMFGASHLVPIINPGQSAILGVGGIKPVFRPNQAGAPVLRQEIGVVLSCDHRVFDGVRAAQFLDLVTQGLENPLWLLRR